MKDIYAVADLLLRGFRLHFGEDWTGEFPRGIFENMCIITGVGQDQRTHDKYWVAFTKVGWIKDKNGKAGAWQFDIYTAHKEFFQGLNGGKK